MALKSKGRHLLLFLSAIPRVWLSFSLFIGTFFFIVFCVYRKLHDGSDGDVGYYFYRLGVISWSDLLTALFVRPADAVFIFGRWRPIPELLFKAFYVSPLNAMQIHMAFWGVVGLQCLAFSWGMVRLLSLGFKLPSGSTFILASLIWASEPLAISSSVPLSFCGTTTNLMFFGFLGVAVEKLLTSKKKNKWFVAVFFSALFCCHSHETSWFLLFWLSGWLYVLKRKEFWWPSAFVIVYLAVFRSFLPSHDGGVLRLIVGESLLRRGVSHLTYCLLLAFNGIQHPISDLIQLPAGEGLDITPGNNALAFLLTVVAVYLASKFKAKPAHFRLWSYLSITLGIGLVFSTSPFWLTAGYLLSYFVVIPSAFLASWVLVSSYGRAKPSWIPIGLLLVGNMIATYWATTQWNFTDLNTTYTRQFADAVIANPETKGCSVTAPCCLDIDRADPGRSAWSIAWNQGGERQPAFIPIDQPDRSCVRTIKIH